jgi:hypothetical protein
MCLFLHPVEGHVVSWLLLICACVFLSCPVCPCCLQVENQAGTPSAGVKQGMDGDTADTPCGGASSSEECDMFLACTEPAVC